MGNAKFLLSFLVLLSRVVRSEIIPIYLILDASSTEVHFVRGWLDAPAHIDLSMMIFLGADEPEFIHADDDGEDGFDDDLNLEFDDDDTMLDDEFRLETPVPTPSSGSKEATPAPVASEGTPVPTPAPVGDNEANPVPGDGGSEPVPVNNTPEPTGGEDKGTPAPDAGGEGKGTSAPDEGGAAPAPDEGGTTPAPAPAPEDEEGTPAPTETPGDRGRYLDGDTGGGISQRVKQVIDIVVFFLPDDCQKNSKGSCDWSLLGVGGRDDYVDGDVSYCCAEDTAARGVCSSDDIGKLIVDHSIFKGEHRTMDVPTTPEQGFSLKDPLFEVSESGEYVMVLGNCDDYGLEVLANGSMEWKSVGGYLPGELFGLMFFYAALTACYLLLVTWYGCGMKMFQDDAIPIQKYIIATMILGLLELFFRALDLGVWNLQGLRSYPVVYASLFLGVLKRGISRCLGVMVAMGWGVLRDSLGFTLAKIVLLGIVYSGLTLFRDFMVIFVAIDVETLSITTEEGLMDVALILTPLILIVNLVFFWWIISSLNATTEYLRNMNQTSKLRRHLRLRCLMLTSITIAAVWLVFSLVDAMTGILSPDMVWASEGAMHVNYLFVLTGVAILWRPNSNAKDYAMQMEVPALGEDDENELELSCVVPSALDDGDGDDNFAVIDADFT